MCHTSLHVQVGQLLAVPSVTGAPARLLFTDVFRVLETSTHF